jgi:hypothetical protein
MIGDAVLLNHRHRIAAFGHIRLMVSAMGSKGLKAQE